MSNIMLIPPRFFQIFICKQARARVLNARTRDEMCADAFTSRACPSLHDSLSLYLSSSKAQLVNVYQAARTAWQSVVRLS